MVATSMFSLYYRSIVSLRKQRTNTFHQLGTEMTGLLPGGRSEAAGKVLGKALLGCVF